MGQGKYRKKENTPSNAEILENSHLEALRGGISTTTNTKRQNLLEHTDLLNKQKMTMGGKTTSTESCEVLQNIAEEILEQKGLYALNLRTAMLMGLYEKDWGKKKMGTIPKTHDRSQYSQERYKFMLDAPFEISNKCCSVMKKEPLHRYRKETGRVAITAQMASESRLRTQQWIRNGCNAFDNKEPISNPMSFWTEQDVLLYIRQNKIPICSVYGEVVTEDEEIGQGNLADFGLFDLERPLLKTTGCNRTGCMLCGFGCHLEKEGEGRFEMLKKTHPKMYALLDVVKNNGITMREAIDWMNEHGNLGIKY